MIIDGWIAPFNKIILLGTTGLRSDSLAGGESDQENTVENYSKLWVYKTSAFRDSYLQNNCLVTSSGWELIRPKGAS